MSRTQTPTRNQSRASAPFKEPTAVEFRRTELYRQQREAKLRAALADQHAGTWSGDISKDDNKVLLGCAEHQGKPVNVSTLHTRLGKGQLLCRGCDDLTETGVARKLEGNLRRAVHAGAAERENWLRENMLQVRDFCRAFELSIVKEPTSASEQLHLVCERHPTAGAFTVRRVSDVLSARSTKCLLCSSEQHERVSRTTPSGETAQDPNEVWPDCGHLYKIVDSQTNMVYIGLTTLTLGKRWTSHLRSAQGEGPGCKVHKAMAPRIQDFRIEFLSSHATLAELRLAEIQAIKAHNCVWPNGYNSTEGGELRCRDRRAEFRKYAKRQGLSAAQEKALIRFDYCAKLNLSREAFDARMASDMPYDQLLSRPAAKDRAVMLGSRQFASLHDACAFLSVKRDNVGAMASSAGVLAEAALEMLFGLRFTEGPISTDFGDFPLLEDYRKATGIGHVSLLAAMHSAQPLLTCGQALDKLSHRASVVIGGKRFLNQDDACRKLGTTFQTVRSHMNKWSVPFETAVQACAVRVAARKAPRKTVVRTGPVRFRGTVYANGTAAAAAYGIPNNTYSKERAKLTCPVLALESCIAKRAQRGVAIRAL